MCLCTKLTRSTSFYLLRLPSYEIVYRDFWHILFFFQFWSITMDHRRCGIKLFRKSYTRRSSHSTMVVQSSIVHRYWTLVQKPVKTWYQVVTRSMLHCVDIQLKNMPWLRVYILWQHVLTEYYYVSFVCLVFVDVHKSILSIIESARISISLGSNT